MFCKHCGKELSNEAFMCPNCGAPTDVAAPVNKEPEKEEHRNGGTGLTGLSTVSLILACIAFVTGVVFGAFFFEYSNSAILLYVLSATTILPALAALSIGAYTLCAAKNGNKLAKSLSITAIVLSGAAVLFLFLAGCLLGTDALYSYGEVVLPQM